MARVLGDDAKVVYMVRNPIDRMLSHYLHNVGGGYETRPLEEALADTGERLRASGRSTPARPSRTSSTSARSAIAFVTREELKRERRAETMRRMFGFVGVDEELQLAPVRARVGDRERARERRVSADGPGRAAARACARSTATSIGCPSACAGSSSGSSTTRLRRGAEAGAARRAARPPRGDLPAGRGAARGARRAPDRLVRVAPAPRETRDTGRRCTSGAPRPAWRATRSPGTWSGDWRSSAARRT